MYGSRREVLTGIVRALPKPGSAVAERAIEIAHRLPRAAREQRPHLIAMCEVAQMLAEGVGVPSSVHDLLAQLTERWDGKGPLGRAEGEGIPLPGGPALSASTRQQEPRLPRCLRAGAPRSAQASLQPRS
jgi:HD domain